MNLTETEQAIARFIQNAMRSYPKRANGFQVNFSELCQELDGDPVMTLRVLLACDFKTMDSGEWWTRCRSVGVSFDLMSAFPEGSLVDILDIMEPVEVEVDA